MQNYQRILVAIDVYTSYSVIMERALAIASKPDDISLVFVTLPTVYFQPYVNDVAGDFVADVRQQGIKKLGEIAKQNHLPDNQIYVPIGSPAQQIHDLAAELKSDLIIIGTHGQSGLKLLLGSTANAVLHGVKCDVLAVRVFED